MGSRRSPSRGPVPGQLTFDDVAWSADGSGAGSGAGPGRRRGPAVVAAPRRDRVADNLAALRLSRELELAGREVSVEERAVLAGWSGWEGLTHLFDERREEHAETRAELAELLDPEELAALRRAARRR